MTRKAAATTRSRRSSTRRGLAKHATLTVDDDKDYVTDNGKEVYSIMKEKGIDTVLVMGVHTNMCILNRIVRDQANGEMGRANVPRSRHDRRDVRPTCKAIRYARTRHTAHHRIHRNALVPNDRKQIVEIVRVRGYNQKPEDQKHQRLWSSGFSHSHSHVLAKRVPTLFPNNTLFAEVNSSNSMVIDLPDSTTTFFLLVATSLPSTVRSA